MLGVGLVGVIILIGVLAPLLIAPEMATKMHMTARLSPPSSRRKPAGKTSRPSTPWGWKSATA
ncbi:MAG: hypothetical protein Q8J60_08980 [Thiobacillus sp.]|nr:hypothetical protein [Thiobacillus sp.]